MFCVLDQESKQQFTKIIHEISGYESIVQRDKADKSFFHVYGEQIQIGMRSIAMLLVRKVVTCIRWTKINGHSWWHD